LRNRKIVLFGEPGVGKTTLTERLVALLEREGFCLRGFVTREVREGGRRVGFDIRMVGENFVLPLARVNAESRYRVGRYGVFVENVEKVVDRLKSVVGDNDIFVIDEVGKMELFSRKFREFINGILSGYNFILTVGLIKDELNRKLLSDRRFLRVRVDTENRNYLLDRLLLEFVRAGKLIVFEGIDGCGKTTISAMLYEVLRKRGLPVVYRREPTDDGPYGRVIREKIYNDEVDRAIILNLFLKDRLWHVEKVIIPALKKGDIVILDRYYISTLTYQGAQGFDLDELMVRCETISPTPDLVYYIDVPFDVAMARLKGRSDIAYFEKIDFLNKVSNIYQEVLPLYNHVILDGTQDPDRILSHLLSDILSRISREPDRG